MDNVIDCRGSVFRIGNKLGRVPKNHDCIIEGFHLKGQKIVKSGNIKFIPQKKHGKTKFILKNNVVEPA